jgi:Fe-S-cluster containining protein
MNETEIKTPFKPIPEQTFKFRCHKEISCFTRCCANLNLVLTPYDILRLKKRLDISSDEFLEKFTETNVDKHPRFPMMTLKMNMDQIGACPFVISKGCTIYEDRPGACRIYPLGRAAMKVDKEKDAREKFFIVQEEHCLGFEEERKWSVEEWMANEGVSEYNAMNDHWLEIISSPKSLGKKEEIPRKIQMFSMASYNLDKFRTFLFQSRFFSLFEVSNGLNDKLRSDDVALMLFSFDWLKFSLFGEKTLQMKS